MKRRIFDANVESEHPFYVSTFRKTMEGVEGTEAVAWNAGTHNLLSTQVYHNNGVTVHYTGGLGCRHTEYPTHEARIELVGEEDSIDSVARKIEQHAVVNLESLTL